MSLPPPSVPDLPEFTSGQEAAVVSPVEVGKSLRKELRGLGHKLERFLAARAALVRHVSKMEPPIPQAWLPDSARSPGALAGDGLFSCPVILTPDGFRLFGLVASQERTAQDARRWQEEDPSAPRTLPAPLAVPVDANSPLWLALLRLRPLHSLWERELRRGTLDDLLDHAQDAWFLDPTPLPPGAVIPRLGLPSWDAVPQLRATGRRFLVAPRDTEQGAIYLGHSQSLETWQAAIREALEAFPENPRILLELPETAMNVESFVIAFYEKKADRVDCLGAFALPPLIVTS